MTDERRLDGNAAAGRLRDVFVFDASTARTTCAGCGMTAALASFHVYADAPGMIVRCPDCDAAVVRIAQTPSGTWLDMRGTAVLDIRA